jgi:hypothetical protein
MFNLCGEDVYIQIVKGENKHRPFTLEWRILIDFQCKRILNGHIKKIKVFIFENLTKYKHYLL